MTGMCLRLALSAFAGEGVTVRNTQRCLEDHVLMENSQSRKSGTAAVGACIEALRSESIKSRHRTQRYVAGNPEF